MLLRTALPLPTWWPSACCLLWRCCPRNPGLVGQGASRGTLERVMLKTRYFVSYRVRGDVIERFGAGVPDLKAMA